MVDRFNRDETRQKVMAGLKNLVKERGVSPEAIAMNLSMSYPTVKNWMAGRRIPKPPIIWRIEETWRIKIL
jgi:transcriptional regulator with XRE-family HTH domain